MRVLIVTKIFPNAAEPLAVPFNRLQFAALSRQCEVTLLAAIPWFPGAPLLGARTTAGRLLRVPDEEFIEGLRVRHPRVMLIPRIGHRVSGWMYAASLLKQVWPLRGREDVVLGSWAYPDGMAAVLLARLLGVPAVVKVHGSDINVLSRTPSTQRNVRWALRNAEAVVAPSESLVEAIRGLGIAPQRVSVVPNGLDRTRFAVRDRETARRALSIDPRGKWIVYLGRLELTKGLSELAQAFEELAAAHPDVRLALVGDGNARALCQRLQARMPERVVCAGARSHQQVPDWLAAADVVTLPSYNEGMPNTVLEALASGRRVVATAVGGIPSVVTSPLLGELVAPRDPSALQAALLRALSTHYDPNEVAAAVQFPSWDESAARLRALLTTTVEAARAPRPHAATPSVPGGALQSARPACERSC